MTYEDKVHYDSTPPCRNTRTEFSSEQILKLTQYSDS